ncbi:hypothetical protein POVWA2_043380 [Plasmodium ovale wallikeri]|uniref:Uncharacterized protein n=1 Tax=Plasmodium ovale wallikeri TaxID=864142 RepID=A0A1A8ZD97_PLAOA|nr:hypothetical protein POVWA1_044790 [Plasmodium ovale wallikeri]SBT42181.1 hypothetical protein POVWA2_043380 [Plasmodium ovale wallikeri]
MVASFSQKRLGEMEQWNKEAQQGFTFRARCDGNYLSVPCFSYDSCILYIWDHIVMHVHFCPFHVRKQVSGLKVKVKVKAMVAACRRSEQVQPN